MRTTLWPGEGRLFDTLRAHVAGDLARRSAPDQPGAVNQPSGVDQPDEGGLARPSALSGPRFPALAEAAFAGDLSVDAAGLNTPGLEPIVDQVSGDQLPALERRLVDKAVQLGAHGERERLQYEARYLTWSEDHTGMVTLWGERHPVTAAPLRTVIEHLVTVLLREFRTAELVVSLTLPGLVVGSCRGPRFGYR